MNISIWSKIQDGKKGIEIVLIVILLHLQMKKPNKQTGFWTYIREHILAATMLKTGKV